MDDPIDDNAEKEFERALQKEQITRVAKATLERKQLMDMNARNSILKRATIVEKSRKHASVLSAAEREVLKKKHSERTVEERKLIMNTIVSQACFRRFPPKVRARLATVLEFQEVPTGTRIIQKDNIPTNLYFLISGNVAKLSRKYCEAKHRHVVKMEYIICPPEMVGEIELLEGYNRRTHTYRTRTPCELFSIDLDDFDQVLRPIMTTRWNEIKFVLNDLPYFDHFTTDQRLAALHFAQIRQYASFTHVYPHEDTISYAYFLCTGECAIMQNLKMKAKVEEKETKYELVDIMEDDIIEEVLRNVDQERKLIQYQRYENALKTEDEKDEKKRKEELVEEVIKSCGIAKSASVMTLKKSLRFNVRKSDIFEQGSISGANESNSDLDQYMEELEIIEESLYSNDDDGIEEKSSQDAIFRKLYKIPSTISNIKQLKKEVQCHIVDIGTLTRGAVFGLGEPWEHRILIARSTLKCLLLPRYWLFSRDQNPGDIWQRRSMTLNFAIPSRENLFNDFLRTRNWEKRKEEIVTEAVNQEDIYQPWLLSVFE